MMKRVLLMIFMLLCGSLVLAFAEDDKWLRIEAADLNLIGKAFDTPNPYHRVDTLKYDLVEKRIKEEARDAAGLAVLFRTDASSGNDESFTADGVHPTGFGYSRWERSVEKPILNILKKYKIK